MIIWIGVAAGMVLLLSAGMTVGYRSRQRRPPAGVVRVRLQQTHPTKRLRALQLVALRKPDPPFVNSHNGSSPSAERADAGPPGRAPLADSVGGGRAAPTAAARRSSGPTGESARRRNERTGQAARAVQADQTIRERIESEDDPVAIFDFGVALYETGDLQGARDAWQRAMERGHRRAAVNLGFLLQRMGDRRGARKAYLKAADWGDPVAARLAEGLVVRSDKAGDAG